MPDYTVICPECKRQLNVSHELHETRMKCRFCRAEFTASTHPGEPGPAPQPSAPSEPVPPAVTEPVDETPELSSVEEPLAEESTTVESSEDQPVDPYQESAIDEAVKSETDEPIVEPVAPSAVEQAENEDTRPPGEVSVETVAPIEEAPITRPELSSPVETPRRKPLARFLAVFVVLAFLALGIYVAWAAFQ